MRNKLVQRRPFLPGCLLLLVGEEPGHGYELTERLKQWGFDLTGPGPVYRELRLLEENGLVRSMWSAPQSGPVPRVYELTDEGRDALDGAATDLLDISRLLDDFQARHRRLPSSPPSPPPALPGSGGRRGRSRRS
jgi:PadR family transcriptional regulator, regulatory protein PadR